MRGWVYLVLLLSIYVGASLLMGDWLTWFMLLPLLAIPELLD